MAQITNYRDLIVWQKSIKLVIAIYKLTEKFPSSEVYGLSAQMRRAAVSIPSNIAEGKARGSQKNYRVFLLHAFGSGAELEAQLEITKQLPFGKYLDYSEVGSILLEVMKMLNSLINKLKI
ncbi:MAG: four helix bundle protein [Patescibacteria group bacterium]